jgi:hypothetical protein
MRNVAKLVSCVVTLAAVGPVAQAATITQWNFNSAVGVNNAPMPSVGAGSATPVGMNGGANNADILVINPAAAAGNSSDPASPNHQWRVRGSQSNGWSGTTQLLSGARFKASTVGFQDIVVSFDIQATDGSPRHAQFQYTIDGTSFVSFGGLLDFNATSDKWRTGVTFDLSAVDAVENNASFGFQLVSAFSPVEFTNANGVQPANTAFQRTDAGANVYNGTAGNYRFDMVTISSIPEPSVLAPLAVAALVLGRKRR